jgi:hypothetical protein
MLHYGCRAMALLFWACVATTLLSCDGKADRATAYQRLVVEAAADLRKMSEDDLAKRLSGPISFDQQMLFMTLQMNAAESGRFLYVIGHIAATEESGEKQLTAESLIVSLLLRNRCFPRDPNSGLGDLTRELVMKDSPQRLSRVLMDGFRETSKPKALSFWESDHADLTAEENEHFRCLASVLRTRN